MAADKRAYTGTSVSVDKSMGEVMSLLHKRSVSGMQWTREGLRSTLRFRWKSSAGVELCARFTLDVRPPPAPRGRQLSSKQLADVYAQEERRLFRVLVYFLKNLFEAVDGGLLTLEQALLPYLEDSTGQTVGELLAPRLALLAARPLALALGPGGGATHG